MVTRVGNVPLNNRLAKLEPNDEGSDAAWHDYIQRWTRLNCQRAGAALLAALLLLIPLWQ